MYTTKDGKKKGSAYVGKRYDEMHGKDAVSDAKESTQHEAAETPEFEAGEQEGMKEKEGNTEMHPMVAQHGKAVHVEMHHDHANGKHSVKSTHEDGHVNMSDHQSPEEAHEEGGKLAGVAVSREHPEDAQQGAHSESDGFEMPPLV
jgi:hypothetical protein